MITRLRETEAHIVCCQERRILTKDKAELSKILLKMGWLEECLGSSISDQRRWFRHTLLIRWSIDIGKKVHRPRPCP